MAALYLLLGLAGLIAGAELALRGALGLARHWHWPSWLTGLLLLALGTSLPELFVSGFAAPSYPALGLGNVLGSNAFNVGLVFGSGLLVRGRRGLPSAGLSGPGAGALLAASALALFVLGSGGRPPIWFGILLLLAYGGVVRRALRNGRLDAEEREREIEPSPGLKAVLMLVGFAVLAGASRLFLAGALGLAGILGWSEGFAGYLIAAAGTSAPELVTSLLALRKGHPEAIYGNVLGSNVFNLLVVGGTVCLAAGAEVPGEVVRPQLWANLAATALFFLLAPVGRNGRGTRPAGAALVAAWLLGAWLLQG
ncbi:MAG: sodium:calcium antiporter [Planctomycetota bacterium]|nr:MAG: sodium:calcium antiporter [Planctomycetota bacterium]